MALPDKHGLELIKDIQALHPGLPVLAMSMQDESLYAARVLRAGGRGYVMKAEGPERLAAAIRAVLNGEVALSTRMAAKVLESLVGPAGKTGAGPETRLSDRELEVMRLYGEGWCTEEIARPPALKPQNGGCPPGAHQGEAGAEDHAGVSTVCHPLGGGAGRAGGVIPDRARPRAQEGPMPDECWLTPAASPCRTLPRPGILLR